MCGGGVDFRDAGGAGSPWLVNSGTTADSEWSAAKVSADRRVGYLMPSNASAMEESMRLLGRTQFRVGYY